MGNRSGSTRSKSRDNKYKYPENSQIQKNGNQQRPYSSQPNGYSYSNGYGTQLTNNSQTQYTINPVQQPQQQQHKNTNSNKVIYVANYDFTGTSSSGELSFVKGDRLEILDRYT